MSANEMDFLNADGFNAKASADAAMDGEYAPVPDGWYKVRIEAAELVPTKAGTGKMVKPKLRIQGPTQANRVLFDQLLVQHSSAEAQRIGRERYGQLLVAVGFDNQSPPLSQLIGRELDVRTTIRKSKQYGDSNDCVAYRTCENIVAGASDVPEFDDDDIGF